MKQSFSLLLALFSVSGNLRGKRCLPSRVSESKLKADPSVKSRTYLAKVKKKKDSLPEASVQKQGVLRNNGDGHLMVMQLF